MSTPRRLIGWITLVMVAILAALPAPPAHAYIGGPPLSLGMMCWWSTHAAVARIEKLDREKGIVILRKIKDIKGKWPAEVIKHNFAALGQPEKGYALQWAEVDKTVMLFALESYKWGHAYIDGCWYAANTADWQWWNVSHAEPLLLRMYSGKSDRLADTVPAIYAGREVIVPGMVDGNVEDLRHRRAKLQRLRARLNALDYNLKRDLVGPGGDDFLPLGGMPGFRQLAQLPRVGADAQAVSSVDFNGDGRPDLCLAGASRVSLLLNGGDYFTEAPLPDLVGGCRAAVWADYNGDGRPDLLLATAGGPKLYTNLGAGGFRDDSARLPSESAWNLTTAAWIDYDNDGHPDILLGNGYHGLRLYRNRGFTEPPPTPAPPAPPPMPAGKAPPPPRVNPWFDDVSALAGLGPHGIGGDAKGDTLTVCDVNGDGRPDFLYGAGDGVLAIGCGKGFLESRGSGITLPVGQVGPVFADYDGDGRPDLFVPHPDGCKLFHNDGEGRFSDVTETAGLDKLRAHVTSAAWGDLDNDGQPDLVLGCLRGPNRFLRNKGDGTFTDATESLGLHWRIFNTQAVCLVDLNGDGALDLVCNNEGQDSCALLGNPAALGKRTPVTLHVKGRDGVVGSRVVVRDGAGKVRGSHHVSGGDGRGSQAPAFARFALSPGTYKVEVRYTSGVRRGREIEVAGAMIQGVIDEKAAAIE